MTEKIIKKTTEETDEFTSLSEESKVELEEEAEEMLHEDIIDVNVDNSLNMYFIQATAMPLLTKEQEVELGKKIQEGDKEAKDKLIVSNLRLVISIAKKYRRDDVPFEDLIQNGNLGLINAAERFDYSKGYKFSTYAVWWIKQSIQRELMNTENSIRIPVHIREKINKYCKEKNIFEKENGREPTKKEMARIINVNLETIKKIEEYMTPMLSLDASIRSDVDTDTTLADYIKDDSAASEDEIILDMERSKIINIMMNELDERSRNIMIMRFGLDGDRPMTLEEIGEKFNLTRERIRQIEQKSLRKMRRSKARHLLSGYVDDNMLDLSPYQIKKYTEQQLFEPLNYIYKE